MTDGSSRTSGGHLPATDRRRRRTRNALLQAFAQLVHGRRYEHIRVADILAHADVGRSTFYEHYRGKDDLLLHSMGPILDVLAGAATADGDPAALRRVLEHFRQRRDVAFGLFGRPSTLQVRARVVRALAERIEDGLRCRGHRRGGPALPLPLVAAAVAETQVALVREWLRGASPCAAGEMAAALQGGSAALVSALVPARASAPRAPLETRAGPEAGRGAGDGHDP